MKDKTIQEKISNIRHALTKRFTNKALCLGLLADLEKTIRPRLEKPKVSRAEADFLASCED